MNDGSCTGNIFKSVFLEQIPSQIRTILAMSTVDNLQELANLADKILEASQPMSYQFALTSVASNPISKISTSTLTEILTKQFKRLSNEIRDLQSSRQPRSHSNQRNAQYRDDAIIISVSVKTPKSASSLVRGRCRLPRKTNCASSFGDHRRRPHSIKASLYSGRWHRFGLCHRHWVRYISASRGFQDFKEVPKWSHTLCGQWLSLAYLWRSSDHTQFKPTTQL